MDNIRPRIIPALLIKGDGLVKGINYKNHIYIGDPINALKTFNEKEVDELLFLDITASSEKRLLDTELVKKLADECYMPFTVGGGITNINQIRSILRAGAEKVSINTAMFDNLQLIKEASEEFGSQAIVASVDYRYGWFGKRKVAFMNGKLTKNLDLIEWIKEIEEMGAGELILNSIDNDGMMEGYDLNLLKKVTSIVKIPVIASCGAGNLSHIKEALTVGGVSAIAAGSMFVFYGGKKGILINYPDAKELEEMNI